MLLMAVPTFLFSLSARPTIHRHVSGHDALPSKLLSETSGLVVFWLPLIRI
jgi:hypothetical protein